MIEQLSQLTDPNIFAWFATLVAHLCLSVILFFLINWIGKHAIDFGYASTTLFDDFAEKFLINFLIRTTAPSVYIIILSAIFIGNGIDYFRENIFMIVIYYYVLRAIAIVALNQTLLISWPKFAFNSLCGISLSFAAYYLLILPNRALLPDLDDAGNEVWLAIVAFLYAVASKITLPVGPRPKRRNSYIRHQYNFARANFSETIESLTTNPLLQLVIYSVIIYENYARPPVIRFGERFVFWKKFKSTGIMQVGSHRILSDLESVQEGTMIVLENWNRIKRTRQPKFAKVNKLIAKFNPDSTYVERVLEVMEIVSKQVDENYRNTFDSIQ